MRNFKVLLLLFPLIFSIVHAAKKNICPTNFCGSFSLDYPFKLSDSQPENNCNYMNLTCNAPLGLGTPTLNLPYAGDFYVRYIDYYVPYIKLYDPQSCLMGRLMKNLNLSSSPFKAKEYENYTFYTCPLNQFVKELYDFPIHCLSNHTHSTVATALVAPELMLGNDCVIIGSWLLPVLERGQFEFEGIDGDLYLTWNSTNCEACKEAKLGTGGSKSTDGNSWAKFAASHFFVPLFTAMAFVVVICILKILKCIARNDMNSDPHTLPESTAAPPGSIGGGLDESRINSCSELVVLSESRVNPGLDSNSITCAICLDNFQLSEIVRSIVKCGHCFHADCIELWLRKNSTCPVCRTSLAHQEL